MIRRFTLALALALTSSLAAASDSEAIASALKDYQRESGVPVADLDIGSLADLERGETLQRKVRVTRSGAGGNDTTTVRIIGYRVIDKPREPLWIAALAFDGGYSDRLTEHLVTKHDGGGASWYQHVDMPWPLRDRHWLIRTGKGVPLTERLAGRVWEHHWHLEPDASARIEGMLARVTIPGLPPERVRKAVELPLNNGAWVMATLGPERTLVVLHATMDMGGIIPDALVNRYTRRQLRSMLANIEARADEAWKSYSSDYLIYRGDGTPIEPVTAARAARGTGRPPVAH